MAEEKFHDDLGDAVRALTGLQVGEQVDLPNDNTVTAAYNGVLLYNGYHLEYRTSGNACTVRRVA